MEMLNICGYFMLWYGMGGTDNVAEVLSWGPIFKKLLEKLRIRSDLGKS